MGICQEDTALQLYDDYELFNTVQYKRGCKLLYSILLYAKSLSLLFL